MPFFHSKANGEIVKDRAETDENGIITLTGLTDCTLVVTEIEAPDGYILQDMPKTIEVKAGGNYELTFTNKRPTACRSVRSSRVQTSRWTAARSQWKRQTVRRWARTPRIPPALQP